MSRPIDPEHFRRWANERGIGPDRQYPDSGCLSYDPDRQLWWFWKFPTTPACWPHFATSLLAGLEPWQSCAVWFRGGTWPDLSETGHTNDELRAMFLRFSGVPSRFEGAIEYDWEEQSEVVAWLFVQMAFCHEPEDDLFIIPDHGRGILHLDHHSVIHASFRERGLARSFIYAMKAANYHLPTELPDPTFKRPRWMKGPRPDPDQAG